MAEEGIFWVDEEEGLLIFKDEEGETRFLIEDEFTLDDGSYLVLVTEEDEDEVIIMKLIVEGDEEILTIIEDDEEFARARDAYFERLDAEELADEE